MCSSLYSLLPAPSQVVWDREDEAREQKLRQRPVSALVKAVVTAPPYGQRKGWVPRNPEVSFNYYYYFRSRVVRISSLSRTTVLYMI